MSEKFDKERFDSLLKEINEHPEKHQHTDRELFACCMIDGAFNPVIMDAHSTHPPGVTSNALKHDVISGPCACGAWHNPPETSKE